MPVPVPQQYQSWVSFASSTTGLPQAVVAAQIQDESDWNPQAVSPTGAQGIAQFEPGTWAQWGHGSPFSVPDAFHAYAAYMSSLLVQENGNVRNALAAYNAGPGNLAAGYGYADTILANAGTGTTIVVSPPGSTLVGGQVPQSGGLGGFVSGVWKDLTLPLSGIAGVLGSASAIAQAIAAVAAPLIKIAEAIDWFFHPAHWIRLLAGVAGGVLVLGGVWQMSHAGGA